MKYSLLAASGISALGFVAHTFFGTKEAYLTFPSNNSHLREWHMILSAWHLISADLLLNTSVSILILKNKISKKFVPGSLLMMSSQNALWTIFWLSNLMWIDLPQKHMYLFQWGLFGSLTYLYWKSM